jgi:hypothetical protein
MMRAMIPDYERRERERGPRGPSAWPLVALLLICMSIICAAYRIGFWNGVRSRQDAANAAMEQIRVTAQRQVEAAEARSRKSEDGRGRR